MSKLTDAAFLALLGCAACRDIRKKKIPVRYAAGILLLAVVKKMESPNMSAFQAAEDLILSAAPGVLVNSCFRGAFGKGDLYLAGAIGAYLGWKKGLCAQEAAIFLAAGFCLIRLIVKKTRGREKFAFGPFLCMGAALVWIKVL